MGNAGGRENPIGNIQSAFRNRKSNPLMQGKSFFGRGEQGGFGLASGFNDKYQTYGDGTVGWRGISGILQFIHKFPFGYMSKSDWAKSLNQILWNIIIFIGIFGAIYGGMIKSGALGVPDGIADQTPDPMAQGYYFAVVTMTTLGFGDITPATVGGQVMVMFQILLFFIFNFIWTLEYDPSELLQS